MPGCTIDRNASPQFKTLRDRWRSRYPHIDQDLEEAFKSIEENILAKKSRRVQAGAIVEVYKYRQNSKDIRRGDRYGWRIYALYVKATGTMYPIIVFPKPVWDDADTRTVLAAIQEIRMVLGYCVSSGCDGKMSASDPVEKKQEGESVHVKTQCCKCKAVYWKTETA